MRKHTLSWWKKQADKYFSICVRRLEVDKNGYCACITCGVKKPWKEMQNGHYIPRNHLSTRFDERNCAPQCVGCNMFGRGKHDQFALVLIKKYGKDILEELNSAKNKPTKYKISDYQEMVEMYQDALAGLDMRDGKI